MIRVADNGIIEESCSDGECLRLVVFTQGCKHNCVGCHNVQTHNFESGTDKSAYDIFKKIKENPLLDGITFSGGDPFFQAKQCLELAKFCRESGYTVWAYTGFEFEEFLKFKNSKSCSKFINKDMLDFFILY